MITTKTFTTNKPGPKILFLGAIHGNEVCGPLAMQQIITDFELENLKLKAGSVTFVPVCNAQAREKKVRFIDEDLNRVFEKTEAPKTYERELANELTATVDHCDVMLDIHSTLAGGPVNVFIDFPTPENMSFAQSLHAPYAILGWPKLYEKSGQALLSSDTTIYANKMGKTCLLIECGQHDDPAAVPIARDAIIATLAHFKLIQNAEKVPALHAPMQEITMTDLFTKNSEGDQFTKQYRHLDIINAGEVIGTRQTGEKIIADRDCVMVLPKLKGLVGREWFYLGVPIKARSNLSRAVERA